MNVTQYTDLIHLIFQSNKCVEKQVLIYIMFGLI